MDRDEDIKDMGMFSKVERVSEAGRITIKTRNV